MVFELTKADLHEGSLAPSLVDEAASQLFSYWPVPRDGARPLLSAGHEASAAQMAAPMQIASLASKVETAAQPTMLDVRPGKHRSSQQNEAEAALEEAGGKGQADSPGGLGQAALDALSPRALEQQQSSSRGEATDDWVMLRPLQVERAGDRTIALHDIRSGALYSFKEVTLQAQLARAMLAPMQIMRGHLKHRGWLDDTLRAGWIASPVSGTTATGQFPGMFCAMRAAVKPVKRPSSQSVARTNTLIMRPPSSGTFRELEVSGHGILRLGPALVALRFQFDGNMQSYKCKAVSEAKLESLLAQLRVASAQRGVTMLQADVGSSPAGPDDILVTVRKTKTTNMRKVSTVPAPTAKPVPKYRDKPATPRSVLVVAEQRVPSRRGSERWQLQPPPRLFNNDGSRQPQRLVAGVPRHVSRAGRAGQAGWRGGVVAGVVTGGLAPTARRPNTARAASTNGKDAGVARPNTSSSARVISGSAASSAHFA